MKKTIFCILFISGISLASFSSAAVLSISVSNMYPVQGDTVRITVSGSASAPQTATLGGETANFFPYGGRYIAAVGLKVTAQTGWQKITLAFADGATRVKWIDVLKKKITVETFAVPPQIGMTPTELVQSLNDENATLDKILNAVTPQSYITGAFGLPLLNNTHITDWYGILSSVAFSSFKL